MADKSFQHVIDMAYQLPAETSIWAFYQLIAIKNASDNSRLISHDASGIFLSAKKGKNRNALEPEGPVGG